MQVSLKSVEWSNAICNKIMFFHKNHGKGLSKEFSVEIGKDLFAVLSSAISSARFVAMNCLMFVRHIFNCFVRTKA